MKCKECGNEIVGRRPNSVYCSKQCSGRAKRKRQATKLLNGLNGVSPFSPNQMIPNQPDELRQVERDYLNKITELKDIYNDKIHSLKDKNTRQEFKIERLEDKIKDLESKHSKDLIDANKSATKDIVQTISSMPAVQSTLGNLANSFISKGGKGLAGVESDFSEGEKQIIESIRKMQPETQKYLVQMLYILFAKTNEEQMEIFTTLQAYMSGEGEIDDEI